MKNSKDCNIKSVISPLSSPICTDTMSTKDTLGFTCLCRLQTKVGYLQLVISSTCGLSLLTFPHRAAICWTAITGFSLSQLPGVLARMSNAIYGNNLRTKPSWLVRFLAMRKHLGLVALWFLLLHIFMSMLLFNPGYYSKFFIEKEGTSKMNSIGENSFFFAIIGRKVQNLFEVFEV